jgi:hypothetical protein
MHILTYSQETEELYLTSPTEWVPSHLRTETDPISEMLYSVPIVFETVDDGQSPEAEWF